MSAALFTFYGILNSLLPNSKKGATFSLVFEPHQSLKHLIESLGIPHTEVGQVMVNGQSCDLMHRLQDGDRVEVYPVDDFGKRLSTDMPRFVLDGHLGRLAVYLRMLGFDTLYRNDYSDDELAKIACRDGRVLLTRDRRLLMRKNVLVGSLVYQRNPRHQVLEVVQRFDLFGRVRPFQRCLRCNHPLQRVDKKTVLDRLEPLTKQYYDEFHLCPACNQLYWKGSHYERMLEMVQRITQP